MAAGFGLPAAAWCRPVRVIVLLRVVTGVGGRHRIAGRAKSHRIGDIPGTGVVPDPVGLRGRGSYRQDFASLSMRRRRRSSSCQSAIIARRRAVLSMPSSTRARSRARFCSGVVVRLMREL